MAFLHQIRLKKKRKMDQIGLKIDGVNKCFFGPKIPVFFGEHLSGGLEGYSPPPICGQCF